MVINNNNQIVLLWLYPSLEVFTEVKIDCVEKLHRQGTLLHRVMHINYNINTCAQVLLHIINLADWHVRQPLGQPLLACLASRLARGYLCQQVLAVVVFKLWKKNTVETRSPLSGSHCPTPLSSSEYIILIYDWESLSSIFWWPRHITLWHKSLHSERAV